MSSNDAPVPHDPGDDHPSVQRYVHQPVAARVPERVARGVYATGQLVLDTPKDFIIDFFQGITRPYQVVARVVMTPQTMAEFIGALRQNIDKYTGSFGPPPTLPMPPQQPRPTLAEIYERYRISDDMLAGSYANSVMIGHSPAEFFFDFIAGFYPNPAVSARVFLPAPQAPRFLNTLTTSLQQHQQRRRPGAPGGGGGSGETPPTE